MKKKDILIVDDVQENLQVLGSILKEQGFNISFARDGEQALKGISKRSPELVLLDISMPVLDGFETCRILQEDGETKDIPIIFLTARSEVKDMVKGFKLGAVDYVTKPFNKEELLARVNTHLELKEARDTIKKNLVELERKNEELYISSITDRLTQAYNRLYLMDTLNRGLSKSRRKKSPLSCIIMDIDYFKKVNDTHGHLGGDLILQETSKLIQSMIRNEDIFGRYGGEEFLLLLPECSLEDAEQAGEKIRNEIEKKSFVFGNKNLNITMSMGLAEARCHKAGSEEELISFADLALYKAKESGRNRIITYKTEFSL